MKSGLVRRFLSWAPQAFPHERADGRQRAGARLSPLRPQGRCARRRGDRPDLVCSTIRSRLCAARWRRPSPAPARRRAISCWRSPATSRRCRARCSALSPLLATPISWIAPRSATPPRSRRSRAARGSAPPVAAALAEVGERAAVLALIGNLDADLSGPSLWRLFERFKDDAGGARAVDRAARLPRDVARGDRRGGDGRTSSAFAAGSAWLEARRAERIARDGREQAFVAIAADCPDDELAELVAWLRAQRTPDRRPADARARRRRRRSCSRTVSPICPGCRCAASTACFAIRADKALPRCIAAPACPRPCCRRFRIAVEFAGQRRRRRRRRQLRA